MCSHTSRLVHSCFWLRCLIYKVQAPSSRTALIDYHIFRSLSSAFFKVFQTFQMIYRFSAFQPAALADSLIRLPHSSSFVKHFFQSSFQTLRFSIIFDRIRPPSASDNFDRIPLSFLFVKLFFRSIGRMFICGFLADFAIAFNESLLIISDTLRKVKHFFTFLARDFPSAGR